MKLSKKWIVSIAAAIVAVGAAVTAIVLFHEQLSDLIKRCPKPSLRPKEFDDYADVE